MFQIDDLVETVDTPRFWGKLIYSFRTGGKTMNLVAAIHPDFLGTTYIASNDELRLRVDAEAELQQKIKKLPNK
jgi:hypothetical protein